MKTQPTIQSAWFTTHPQQVNGRQRSQVKLHHLHQKVLWLRFWRAPMGCYFSATLGLFSHKKFSTSRSSVEIWLHCFVWHVYQTKRRQFVVLVVADRVLFVHMVDRHAVSPVSGGHSKYSRIKERQIIYFSVCQVDDQDGSLFWRPSDKLIKRTWLSPNQSLFSLQ